MYSLHIHVCNNSKYKQVQTYKYVGLPSHDQVYKKHAGEKTFLMFIPDKNFF